MPAKSKTPYFSAENIREIQSSYSEIENKYAALCVKILTHSWKNERAREFAHNGFSRRIGTMKRCIDNVFRITPPDNIERLETEDRHDLVINLQAFIANVYGALDNLAWMWVQEKNVLNKNGQPLTQTQIGFGKKYAAFRESLPQDIIDYLNSDRQKAWFSYLEGFRHSLAHRIPLYVPPYVLTEEEMKVESELEAKKMPLLRTHQFDEYEKISEEIDALGKFVPCMTHSFGEKSPQAVFHAQVIADWNTVEEISNKFMSEFKKTT